MGERGMNKNETIIQKKLSEIETRIAGKHYPALFTDMVRVQMVIDRGVSNSNKGSMRWVNKLISHDSESFFKNCKKLLHMMLYYDEPEWRLYSSVNPRNPDHAGKLLIADLVMDLGSDFETTYWKRLNVNGRFVSALSLPESRDTLRDQHFLIDIDTTEVRVAKEVIELIGSSFYLIYDTPNGFHIIASKFDTRIIENIEHVSFKRDGLLLLSW